MAVLVVRPVTSDPNFCDNCKREPEPFDVEGHGTAYWFVVPKENQDPTVLTSALELAFCALVAEGGDKRHPVDDANLYWCSRCAEAAGPDGEEDEGQEA